MPTREGGARLLELQADLGRKSGSPEDRNQEDRARGSQASEPEASSPSGDDAPGNDPELREIYLRVRAELNGHKAQSAIAKDFIVVREPGGENPRFFSTPSELRDYMGALSCIAACNGGASCGAEMLRTNLIESG